MMLLLIPQNLAPDLWSWTEFIRTITGPVIAAVVLIIGISLKERFDRKSKAQQWFRQTYVTDGIDPLIAHLQEIQASLIALQIAREVRSFPPLPLGILTRLTTVVRSVHLLGALTHFESYTRVLASAPDAAQAQPFSSLSTARIELITSYISILDAIRRELLRTKISDEKDVYELAGTVEIRELTTKLDTISDAFMAKQKVEVGKLRSI